MPQPRPLVIPRWIVGALMAAVVVLGGCQRLAAGRVPVRQPREPARPVRRPGPGGHLGGGRPVQVDLHRPGPGPGPEGVRRAEGRARGAGRDGPPEQERLRGGDRLPRPRGGRVGTARPAGRPGCARSSARRCAGATACPTCRAAGSRPILNAVRFATPSGPRLLLSASPEKAYAEFLQTTLKPLVRSDDDAAFLLDGKGAAIAAVPRIRGKADMTSAGRGPSLGRVLDARAASASSRPRRSAARAGARS